MPDPDLEIREVGGFRSPKNFIRPFGPEFGLKITGGVGPLGPSLDPPLQCKA